MKFLLFLSTCLFCQLLQAETYYSDPVAGTPQGKGSADSPWQGLAEAVKAGHLTKLKGGDTLLLRSGMHGDVAIGGDNSSVITITAQEGHTPQLSRLEIKQGSKWLLKKLTISSSFAAAPYKGYMVNLGERGASSDLTLEDCFVYGELDSSQWTIEQWMNATNGILVGRNGTNITLRNNYVLNTRFAVSVCSPDSLCEGNTIVNFSADGIRATRDNIVVQYNIIKNAFVSDADGDKNHDDLIQVFLFNKGKGTVKNITVRDNLLIGHDNATQAFANMPQGIGFFDGPLVDFVVEKNVVLTDHYHGISLYGAENCQILNNAVKSITPEGKLQPWIMLGIKKDGVSTGNRVENNIACSFNLKADASVMEKENKVVTEEAFTKAMQTAQATIFEKFGETHPLTKLPKIKK